MYLRMVFTELSAAHTARLSLATIASSSEGIYCLSAVNRIAANYAYAGSVRERSFDDPDWDSNAQHMMFQRAATPSAVGFSETRTNGSKSHSVTERQFLP